MSEIYENVLNFLMNNPNNIVVAVLAVSIAIVFISIVYVLLQSAEPPIPQAKKPKIEKKIPKHESTTIMGKTNKVKYAKEFLRRVKGLDLDLK